ncbi:PCI domain-containing protein 2 -like protein [Trichinella nelsoni]|uniref:PCI domain-containing protein 2-like protein n=1 Tax=Trichinella nelsoni TaxID=6336 RepID=A0A0V0S3P0_9BILA|nr:PCI domain-containing protein 2 -like protein [Trichinella nelsoni]
MRNKILDFSSVNAFLRQISEWGQGGTTECGKQIKKHVSFQREYSFLHNSEEVSIDAVAKQYFRNPFDYIFNMHLKYNVIKLKDVVFFHAFKGYSNGFHQQLELVKAFNRTVLQVIKNENWFMPFCCQFSKNLVVLARLLARRASNDQVKIKDIFQKAAGAILQCCELCQADLQKNAVNSKEIGLLSLFNSLCELYFKLGQIDDCNACIEFIMKNNSLFDIADNADKVKYKCYCGQLSLLKWNFKEAEECFTFALKRVPERYPRVRKIILKYLIPTGIFLGKVPSKKLLETYDLMFFHEFTVALKNGNICQLSNAIESNGITFAQLGISFLLHAFPSLCYRRIVRIVARIVGSNIIPLQYLYCAFALSTEGVNVISFPNFLMTNIVDNCDKWNEFHCILVNLIAKKNINASISTEKNALVLNDSTSFPSLSEATYTNPLFVEELAENDDS